MSLLGKPTDADLNTYPHVLLTGPHEWVPSAVDYSNPITSGDPTWAPEPSHHLGHDPRIDEFRNFKGRVQHTITHSMPYPTLLSTNMLSPLNPLTLRSSGPILDG